MCQPSYPRDNTDPNPGSRKRKANCYEGASNSLKCESIYGLVRYLQTHRGMKMRTGLLQAFVRVKSTSGMPGYGTLQSNQHSAEFNATVKAQARTAIGSWYTKNDRNCWELHEATLQQDDRNQRVDAKAARAEDNILKAKGANMGSFLNSTGQTVKLASGHRLQTTDITNMYQPGHTAFLDSLNQGSAGSSFTIEVLKNHLTLINA